MNFKGEYRIDSTGLCCWYQGLVVFDEGLKAAYRQSVLINFMIEESAFMGVQVGMA